MPDSPPAVASGIPWKRISWIVCWLWGFPPVGLWMLWRDKGMNRALKVRVLTYGIVVPILLGIAFMIYEFGAAEKAIQAGGGY